MTQVRLACPQDTDSIMSCLRAMHEENGLFTLAEDKVREIVGQSLNPPPEMTVPPIIGVIGKVGDVQATICLMLAQLYYTEEWHLGDLWNYIRPEFRKENLIEALLGFAKTSSDKVGIPLLSGVVSNKRTAAKIRIYSRHFGNPLGAFFIYKPKAA